MKKRKLLYVLPELSLNNHMKYNLEFIKSLSLDLDIFLILEKGDKDLAKRELNNLKYILINIKNPFIRILKTSYFLIKARILNYKVHYIHYSFISSILSSLIPFTNTYYWNCGMPWLYKKSWYIGLYQKMNYKLIDHFVTGTKYLGEEYSKIFNFNSKKNVIIGNWINIEKINIYNINSIKEKYNIKDTQKVLFFIQRLSERKGAHYIIPIMKEMAKDIIIFISGNGPYEDKLKKEIQENNLEDRCILLGRINNDEILKILSITDIFILPSEEEGMSRALMEAMASEKPAVAFDIGSNKEMFPIKYNNFVSSYKDIKDMIKNIHYLLNNEEKRLDFAKEMRKNVLKYSKENILKEFKEKII